MVIREIVIFTEDTYGVEFFKKLIEKINKRYNIKLRATVHRLAGKCYPKVNRQLIATCNSTKDGVVLIVADAEGENVRDVESILVSHTPKDCPIPIKLLVFQYMIEEWICVGLSIRYSSNPIKKLDEHLRNTKGPNYKYKKWMLPKFVDKLDLQKLEKHPVFVKLLKVLLGKD